MSDPSSTVASVHTIVCVRHGETTWKKEGRTQGQLDSPLTPIGIRQVHELADTLKPESFGCILSSPLGRAVQTAEILAERLCISDWHRSPCLAERCEGVFEGLTQAQQEKQFPECFDKTTGLVNPDSIPLAESTSDFLDRVLVGLKEIRCWATTSNVLVVTHTGVLQALMSLVFDKSFIEECAHHRFGFCDTLCFDISKIQAFVIG